MKKDVIEIDKNRIVGNNEEIVILGNKIKDIEKKRTECSCDVRSEERALAEINRMLNYYVKRRNIFDKDSVEYKEIEEKIKKEMEEKVEVESNFYKNKKILKQYDDQWLKLVNLKSDYIDENEKLNLKNLINDVYNNIDELEKDKDIDWKKEEDKILENWNNYEKDVKQDERVNNSFENIQIGDKVDYTRISGFRNYIDVGFYSKEVAVTAVEKNNGIIKIRIGGEDFIVVNKGENKNKVAYSVDKDSLFYIKLRRNYKERLLGY